MHRRFVFTALLAAVLLAGCGGSSAPKPVVGPVVDAPAGLGYDANPAVYHLGAAIAANAPHSSGDAVTSYTVSPALPAGLVLDPATGVLSGTLVYGANPAPYYLTSAVTPNAPSIAAAISTYWVSPALPAGLLLDAATGVITGTPLVSGEGTYTVTAGNSGGSVTCTLHLTVI